MTCPHCAATTTTELPKRTQLGYRIFRCSSCRHQFNERTGTPYTYLEFPTDLVRLVVLWRVRYKLSLRDLVEMFLERGFAFTHEIDREGNLVDSLLSEYRTMEAAKRFFKAALEVTERAPGKVTTDGHDSYPRAIRETPGEEVTHRCNLYLNSRLEQDHRGLKQR